MYFFKIVQSGQCFFLEKKKKYSGRMYCINFGVKVMAKITSVYIFCLSVTILLNKIVDWKLFVGSPIIHLKFGP